MSQGTPHEPGCECSDVSGSLLALLSGGLAFFLLFTPVLLALLYPRALNQTDFGPVPNPPAPRLQIDPMADLAALRAADAAQLSSDEWEDRAAGIVRIPIESALALTAERGLPGWRKP
jgi:hypothetical protein